MTSKLLNIGANGAIPGSPSQAQCIDLLEAALEMVRDGRVTSVAIVCSMPGGFAGQVAGSNAPDLNLGLDALKADILSAVRGVPAPKSKIMRVK